MGLCNRGGEEGAGLREETARPGSNEKYILTLMVLKDTYFFCFMRWMYPLRTQLSWMSCGAWLCLCSGLYVLSCSHHRKQSERFNYSIKFCNIYLSLMVCPGNSLHQRASCEVQVGTFCLESVSYPQNIFKLVAFAFACFFGCFVQSCFFFLEMGKQTWQYNYQLLKWPFISLFLFLFVSFCYEGNKLWKKWNINEELKPMVKICV